MQRNRLLGHRGAQPLDLGAGGLQHSLLRSQPGPPGTDDANASSSPCLATRHVCTTIERSTPYRSAASRWVACPVTTASHFSHF
jgi:hypothetical protein